MINNSNKHSNQAEKIRKTLLTLLALLTGLLTVLSGCGKSGSPTPSGSGAGTQPTVDPDGPGDPEEDPALNVFPADGDNIEIGIFWEPPHDFTTPEQYDWIRDANITFIEITNRDGAINKEVSDLQLKLAGERGIKVAYSCGVDGKNLMNMSESKLTEYLTELAKNPVISGIHVVDEPAQPWTYAKVCAAISKCGLMPRLNFLPYFATWVFENYQGFVEDTIVAAGKENYGYLCYDQYPFPYYGGDPDMFYNLDLFREIGLKYGVPTAFYIQSIGEGGNFRRTNGGEIRYHTSAGLAYGLKSMTYFTWWTTGFCDEKDYAIISPYGKKTSIYDDVKAVNADILRAGRLLRRLDALEVYHTDGAESYINFCTEANVPLYTSPAGRYGFIISLMEDRETGRDYVMIVNKDYTNSRQCEFRVTKPLAHLYDCTGGEYRELDISSGKVTLDFLPGGFVLLAAGQHDNFVDRVIDADPQNLAKGKPVAVDRVEPGSGFYAYCVTDGQRDCKSPIAKGYKTGAKKGTVEVDLGRVTEVNRIDLYPAGTEYTRGETFPRDFTLEVSVDRENWKEVHSETDYTAAYKAIPSFKFDPQQARYVRLNVTKGCQDGGFEIAEFEIYNDDGSIPAPDNSKYYADPDAVDPNANLAEGRSVKVSSDLGGDWSKDHITDGDRHSNWSSALNRHSTEDGVEWIRIDLGAARQFNEVDLYPRGDGNYFPFNFRIEISDDGKDFTSIHECETPELPSKGEPTFCRLDKTYTARYVRIYAYKLRDVKGFNDGHLFQLSEVEIYNKS
ncbi:MAG: discoidin domain-containing protein [Clostridia bacterium]|nr:discoidin domain-containing protein [Clostridia bacterium]